MYLPAALVTPATRRGCQSVASSTPVGITCRLCERLDCRARAFPSVHRRLQVDENVRGISFYAPVKEEE